MCEVWNPEIFGDCLLWYGGTFHFIMEHFQTCTVVKLLFHWSPLICTSIVFRDRGIVMSQSLLFSQPITNNLSNRCRLPVPFTCPAAVQIYWNKRKFYQKRSTPTGIVLYTNMAAVHWLGHQYCERDVLWKRSVVGLDLLTVFRGITYCPRPKRILVPDFPPAVLKIEDGH